MIIDICMVNATRSQKPEPNHCALCAGVEPVASVATNTMATAVSASAKASGNQRSNQSDRRRPMRASPDSAGRESTLVIGRGIYQSDILRRWNAEFRIQNSELRTTQSAFCILNSALLEAAMLRTLPLCLVALFLIPSASSAQLLAAKDGPIVYGHHHVNATDPAAHKKFWADALGGTVAIVGTDKREVIKIPNVWIFMRTQAAKGSSKGSTADHIGFSVQNLDATLARVKANGFRVATADESPASYNVKGDVANPGPGTRLAFVFGPDDVKVELLEATNQAEPIRLHHMHFFGEQNAAMREWYVKVFGATALPAAANAAFISSTLPGVRLNFSPSTTPVAA